MGILAGIETGRCTPVNCPETGGLYGDHDHTCYFNVSAQIISGQINRDSRIFQNKEEKTLLQPLFCFFLLKTTGKTPLSRKYLFSYYKN
jgi:hypothetical protein